MEQAPVQTFGSPLTDSEADRHLRLQKMLFEFARLFDYDEANDRAIAIVGPAFLDTLLTDMLRNFLLNDEKEVDKLLQPEGHLGTFEAKVSMVYVLGLIGTTIKSDLKLVAKVRNRFAHHLSASFSDDKVAGWCASLQWHRIAMCAPPPNVSARDLFQVGVNQLAGHLHGLVGLARYEKRQASKSGV